MKRILHIMYGDDFAGGASFSMANLLIGLQLSGQFEVYAVVPKTKRGEMSHFLKSNGIKVIDIDVPWIVEPPLKNHSKYWRRIRRHAKHILHPYRLKRAENRIAAIIHQESIDLLHLGGAVIDIGFDSAKEANIPIVWHMREFVESDHGLQYLNKKKVIQKYEKADCLIAVSNAVKDHYSSFLDVPIKIIYNGIASEGEIADIKNKKSVSGKITEIIFMGGISETKGTFEILEAAELFEQNADSEICIDIYGRASSEALKSFERMINDKKLNNRIVYKGWRKLSLKDIAKYDLALVCSRNEAFGRVTAESMCANVLVLGANTGGTKELIDDSRGLLFEQGSPKSIAERIHEILHMKKEDILSVTTRARNFAVNNFSNEAYVSKVIEVYNELLG